MGTGTFQLALGSIMPADIQGDAYARLLGGMDEPGTASVRTLQRRALRKRKLRPSTAAPNPVTNPENGNSYSSRGMDQNSYRDAGATASGTGAVGLGGSNDIQIHGSGHAAAAQAVGKPHRAAALEALSVTSIDPTLVDIPVCCRDCSTDFIFGPSEQALFLQKGWPIPRSRCEGCTLRRKISKSKKSKPGKHERTLQKAGDGSVHTSVLV